MWLESEVLDKPRKQILINKDQQKGMRMEGAMEHSHS